jgi:HAD superfamily hydrolase (TIGR01509 family)
MSVQRLTDKRRSTNLVPALVFDFGNVVAFFDYGKAFERLGSHLGLSAPDIRRRFLDGGFANHLVEFESGRLEPEEFAERLMASAGVSLPYDEFVRAWEDIFWLNEPVARLIEWLDERGYTLILGSNTNILHAPYFRRTLAGTLDRFDSFVLSYEVRAFKPEQKFYDACVTAAGVPASSCVFVDDLFENVEGARRAGLGAVQYVDTPSLVAALRRFGVEVPTGEW